MPGDSCEHARCVSGPGCLRDTFCWGLLLDRGSGAPLGDSWSRVRLGLESVCFGRTACWCFLGVTAPETRVCLAVCTVLAPTCLPVNVLLGLSNCLSALPLSWLRPGLRDCNLALWTYRLGLCCFSDEPSRSSLLPRLFFGRILVVVSAPRA